MNYKHNFSRRRFLALSAAASSSLIMPRWIGQARAAPLAAINEEDAVIAFGLTGPVSDEGWNTKQNEGAKAIQAAFPKAKTLVVESIPFSADASRTFRQFVQEGAQMVFSTSNYGDFFASVVERSPEVAFLEADGRRVADNLGWYYAAHWHPTYVIGVAAGLLSKSGKLGFIASFPVPMAISSSNAFLMGARSVNPAATLQVISINSWFDPQGANQAASALIDNGCDFLFGVMNEASYLQVAEQRGVRAAMWSSDMRRYGKNAYVSSIIPDWTAFYVDQVRKRLEGTWSGGGQTLLPLGGGIDRDSWGESVPADVAAKADAVREKIIGGWSPFTGEIKDTTGAVRVKAGETLDEFALYNWDWSVEGVSGLGT
ncbi:BMP family ABC transporter substrate-binding protein [Aminobacter niigataensis]|uniref:BMP family ABC transporter substrate-binding protein n=1 Tax=Aminobacter niigataensis TaxID=83265 RepID=UPI0024CC147D|nr:BMP family ABC transporter substrate-binding protein [Aminobacter niigataensis]CAI2934921.1 Bmp domain-containing protein [Aminobacter niigataensis]